MGLTTTRELRWDAPGAPVLNGQVGSFYNLIKTFLVSCGWSIEWDEPANYKIALRNSMAHGGNGCYVRVLDNGSFTGGARVAAFAVYEAMEDINSGKALAQAGFVHKAITTSANPRAYTLHGDERQIIGTIYSRSATPPVSATDTLAGDDCNVFGGGDYEPSIAGDPGCWGTVAQTESPSTAFGARVASAIVTMPTTSLAGQNGFTLSRNATLDISPRFGVLWAGTVSSTGIGIGGPSSNMMVNPSHGTLGSHMIPAAIYSAGALRGRLRGVYVPLNNWVSSGGAHVGTIHNPLGTASPLSLAALAGSATTTAGTFTNVGRIFVERILSWDDV